MHAFTFPLFSFLQAREDQRHRPLISFFPPGTNPKAVDLLQKMLTFHPEYRSTVEEVRRHVLPFPPTSTHPPTWQALAHPYLEDLHSQMDEPSCDKPFDFSWEKAYAGQRTIPKPELQRLMYEEMLFFRGTGEPLPISSVDVEGGNVPSSPLNLSSSGAGSSSNPNLPPPPSTAAALAASSSSRQQQQQQQQQAGKEGGLSASSSSSSATGAGEEEAVGR